MKWINVLHIYQPPTQNIEVVNLITKESYSLIADLLESYPKLKITLNISGCLLETLYKNGHQVLIGRFKKLIENDQIELLSSAAYHPILPLIPETEVIRQIEINESLLKKYLHLEEKPKGFYLPEMAFSMSIAKILSNLGYKWIILDKDTHFTGQNYSTDINYIIDNTSLSVIFRDRKYSKTFPPEALVNDYKKIQNETIITAHDGELYGHFHKNDYGYYSKAFSKDEIRTYTVSEYLSSLSKTETIIPRNGSWESTKEELENNIPFALWNDKKNKIHKDLWSFSKLALSVLNKNINDSNYEIARSYYDISLASCSWWWASNKKLGVFSPITWNPTEIEKGVKEALVSIRSLKKVALRDRIKIEGKAHKLIKNIWKKHWKLYSI
jgi:predicted glycosyl hydrolase (DUF1957 family)